MSLTTIALGINSRNFVFFLNTMADFFSLLASFLRITSSQTSVLRQPSPLPKTCPAEKNFESLYCRMSSSREGGFDVSLSWCHRRALFFFSFSCINNINPLAVYPDTLRLEAVAAIRCSASAPPARRPEVRIGGKGWADNCMVWNCR